MIPGLPYDHQLEYIESTGSQYIDTGIVQADNLEVTITYQPVLTSGTVTWGTYFGCGYSDSSSYNILGRHYNTDAADFNPWFTNSTYGECRVPASTSAMNTMTVKSGRCIKDGVNYTISSVSGRMRSYTMYLFSANYSNTSWRSQPCRIARFSVSTSAGTKLADYIPVSVNGVAKMYDRVTGTFPKHYGTFVAGPVASTPLMGVHMYPQVHTAADYVQDGLLAGWSGIAQGGIPYVWKDFSGHKYDLTINPNTSHFESNYLNVGSISTAGAYMEGVLIPGVKHMEICCYVSQKTTNALLFYNGVVPSNMILASHSTAGVLTSNTKRHTAYKRTTGYYALSATHDILYADGAKVVDTTFSSDSWSAGSNSLCLFGRLNDTVYGTAGRIYSARAYSRELTPEEVAHNYRIDKLTFYLPDPE